MLFAAAFYFGWKAFDFTRSLLAFLLISFDPYFFASSRLLQPDGFLICSLLLSMLALLAYFRYHQISALLVSGVAAGLGILSKSPGLFQVPMVGLLLAADWWWGYDADRRRVQGFTRVIWTYLLWLIVVVLIVMALWPVMWVQPVASFQTLVQYALHSSAEVNSPMFFNGQIIPDGEFGLEFLYFYPLDFLWRTTPVILLGLVAGLAAWWMGHGKGQNNAYRRFGMLAFLISALLMMLFFTLSPKKFDRYILPTMVHLDLVAALGMIVFLIKMLHRWKKRQAAHWTAVGLMAVMVGWQAALIWQVSPYFHSYYNPWLGGLEKA